MIDDIAVIKIVDISQFSKRIPSDISSVCQSVILHDPSRALFNKNVIFRIILDPRSIFGTQSVYSRMYWIILPIGISPALVYLAYWKWPHIKIFRSIHIPLAFCTLIGSLCDSYFDTYMTWLIIGLIFHTIIRRWWLDRYALLFSIGADIGSQISWLFIFFIFIYRQVNFPLWWGTTAGACPMAVANANGTFPE